MTVTTLTSTTVTPSTTPASIPTTTAVIQMSVPPGDPSRGGLSPTITVAGAATASPSTDVEKIAIKNETINRM